MTTYAIAGANGDIGQIVANTLLDHGHQVRVVGRHAEKLEPLSHARPGVCRHARRLDLLTRAFSGADAVYVLLPGSYGEADFRAYQNRLGEVIATAICAAGVRYVVNLSSVGVDQPERTGVVLGLHDQEQRLNDWTV